MASNAKNDEQRLLLKPRGAAAVLEISDRQLWARTVPRGPIPCVRIGNSVRYSFEALRAFIASQQQAPQQMEEEFRQQVEDQFDACLSHPVNAGLKAAMLAASRVLAQDITNLGGGPEDGGNHPVGCDCDACDPS